MKELDISRKILRKYGEMCQSSLRHCVLLSEKYSGGSGSLGKYHSVINFEGETVCSLAQQHKASEIVVGNRGISPLKRMMLGSVSSYIANNCDCNIVIVKKQ